MNFLLVEIFMSIICLVSLIIYSQKNQNNKSFLSIMLLFTIISFLIIYESILDVQLNIFIFNFNLKLDYITIILKLIVIVFLLNYIYIIKNFFSHEKLYIKEYILIIWIAIIGVFFIMMSNEFFILYLALELQNLILYIMASLRRLRSTTIEAGMKYYIMGSFSSGLLLYGIIMLFSLFGTLDFIEISYLLKDMYFDTYELGYFIYFLYFIIIGLLFKLGVAPFHWWVPEVYDGASVVVTLFFSIIPKLSLLVVLYKLYIYILIYVNFIFSYFFFSFSIISIIIGFIFSLYQKKIIKFLAYSSIFNAGFFMACFANGTYLSLISLFYFFLPYIFILLGIFFIIISYRKINNERLTLLWDFSLLGNSNYIVGFILSFFFFSLAGIPPLAGFFGKVFIFLSLILNQFFVLFFILICFSVLASFYYFRVIRFIFFSNTLEYVFIKSYLSTKVLIFYFFITIYFFLFYDYFFLYFFNIYSYYIFF